MIRVFRVGLISVGCCMAAAVAQVPASKPTAPAASKSVDQNKKPGAAADKPATGTEAATTQRQVFILPLPGMVGVGLRAAEIAKVEAEADKFGPGQIIVLRINSGGGLLTETDVISEVLTRTREKHRVVAWIEEAISAAAVTGMHCREIYFMNLGSMGSATAYAGDKSLEGEALNAWLDRIAVIAEGAGRNGQVARCMVYSPLVVSYTRDPSTGKVAFFPDASGEKMLSDEKDNLTLTSDQALDCGYSAGTADNETQLFEKMQLVPGTFVVNDQGKKIGEAWAKTLANATKQRTSIEQDLALAGDGPKGLTKKIQLAKQMQDIWKKALPVAMGYSGGGPLMPREAQELSEDLFRSFQEQGTNKSKVACEALDRWIKDLQKQIAEEKKSQRG